MVRVSRHLGAGLILCALGAGPGAATQDTNAERYEACMRLSREDPAQAIAMGARWVAEDGGNPARHCTAAAFMALGQYDQAGLRLETLATLMTEEPAAIRAGLLAQAGESWLLAGRGERALGSFDRAVALAPADLELRIDRSIAHGSLGRYGDAIEDLNMVLEIAPGHSEALILRASAWRHLDSADQARRDVEQAVALNPHNPEAFLERGMIRRLQGDEGGARQDWLRVLALAPEAPAAESAHRHLEDLDVRVE